MIFCEIARVDFGAARTVQSSIQYAIDKRIRKDILIDRLTRLFQSKGIDAKSIRGFDPSLSPIEISWLFTDDIVRLGSIRLERIENSVLRALDLEVAA